MLTKLLSTFFYIGYIPFAPGSAASAVASLICILLYGNIAAYITVFFVVTIIGFMVSGKMEEIEKKKDPNCVVIDEVSGIMCAFFLLKPTIPVILTTYFLFRAFDMFKIYPCNKIEEMGGSAGIMLDDIIAGIYTNIVMHIALRIAGM